MASIPRAEKRTMVQTGKSIILIKKNRHRMNKYITSTLISNIKQISALKLCLTTSVGCDVVEAACTVMPKGIFARNWLATTKATYF